MSSETNNSKPISIIFPDNQPWPQAPTKRKELIAIEQEWRELVANLLGSGTAVNTDTGEQ